MAGRVGAEGHAHADLLPPLRHGEGEDAVDPDRGQQGGEAAEGDREEKHESLRQERLARSASSRVLRS